MISEESLLDLTLRLVRDGMARSKGEGDAKEYEIGMDRFRPNIVVKGCNPYEEDTWQRVRVGAVPLDVVKPCSRCQIPTTDQATGLRDQSKDPQPTTTLMTYRTGKQLGLVAINPKWRDEVFFGQNVVPAKGGLGWGGVRRRDIIGLSPTCPPPDAGVLKVGGRLKVLRKQQWAS